MSSAQAVSIQALTRIFPGMKQPALDAISADVSEGALCGVVGPDGAGKTTLLRSLAGLLKPDSGHCLIHGLDTIDNAEDIRTIIGYMPQRFGLYEELTVSQNLRLYATLQESTDQKGRIAQLVEFAGLAKFQERRARDLSGGMKQKLGLICTLIREPRVLLLDEPTVGLDPRSIDEFWNMIAELRKRGTTILWSTSDLARADTFDQVLLLHLGKELFFGKPEEVKDRVAGRTYEAYGFGDRKREALRALVKAKSVADTTIHGEALRIVLRTTDKVQTTRDLGVDYDQPLQPVPPRFEDGFIDILGGMQPISELGYTLKVDAASANAPPIMARNLVKKFGDFTAVDNVSFELKRGEIFGLLGPNGAGKSTTFKSLCGLLVPTSGEAQVNGRSLITAPTDARRSLGYMAQTFSMYNLLTLGQNLEFFGRVYETPHLKARIKELLSALHLTPFVAGYPTELSLGYKQRLGLACALIHQPQMLFLDEPTAGVDPLTRREFWHHINALASQGATVLVSTHLMDEAEFCDRIGFIYEGKLKVVDTPEKLRARCVKPDLPNPTLHDAFIQLCGA